MARIMTVATELLRIYSLKGEGFELSLERRGCRPLVPGLGAGSRKPAPKRAIYWDYLMEPDFQGPCSP